MLATLQTTQHNDLTRASFQQAFSILRSSKVAVRATQALVTELQQSTVARADKWAERYRVMGNPFPGPWSHKYHPWTRGMMLSDAVENVGQKAAQMGFTEVVLNRALYTVIQRKQDVLYVLPAKTPDASDFSAARFDPALELSELLRNAFTSTKNVGLKRAGANSLYVRGSRAHNHLKSIPCGTIILDEVEEMDDQAVPLARERSSGQNDFQLWMISTPSVPGDGINKIFERSRQEHFQFKCPGCSRYTELIYPDCLVITAEEEHEKSIIDSHLICKECKVKLPHENKWQWLQSGIWVPSFPDRDIFGPHINQLYSSAKACSPVQIAKAALRAQINAADEQEFYNSKLGLPHIVAGANVTPGHVNKCILGYKMGSPDLLNGFLTLGIDVGQHCHYELTAWRFREAIESVDFNAEAFGFVVLAGKFKDFSEADALMYKFKPRMTIVDDMPETRTALAFARRFPGRVKLCHYSSGLSTREIIDHGERITVDRTTWLDQSLGRFINETIKLPMDISAEYRAHVTALVRVYREHRVTGEKISMYRSTADDHYGHARNYSEIALKLAQGSGANSSGTGRKW